MNRNSEFRLTRLWNRISISKSALKETHVDEVVIALEPEEYGNITKDYRCL